MKAIIKKQNAGSKINKHVYGHFSEHLGRCIYNGGYWVGEDSHIPNIRGIRKDIVDAMKAINVPNIRWPGGCFADDYHWMDGIGSKSERIPIINVHWGGQSENNHFGTHEFMDLCEQIGCEAFICGNVGSGTVREMRDWVEYLTCDGESPMAQLRRKNGRDKAWEITMFGIGNENWGCGGFLTAEQYAHEFRKYATYVRNYKDMGKYNWWQNPYQILRIAGGHNAERIDWAETLMSSIPLSLMGGLSVHCYVSPGEEMSGTEFSYDSWYQTAYNTYQKEVQFKLNLDIMDKYDPDKKAVMAVDEWGIWVNNEPGTETGFLYQQNTMRSALCAVLMLHMFHKYADRIQIANLAQTINVLQAIILTDDDKLIKTPTYHVFDLLKEHQDGTFINSEWIAKPDKINKDLPHVDISSSIKDGILTVSLVNLSLDNEADVELELHDLIPESVTGRYISGTPTAHNTFENPCNVETKSLSNIKLDNNTIHVKLPKCCIASVTVSLK